MLSRNLVKQVFTVTVSDEKRVIDTNGVLRQRREMAELQEKQPMKEGFVSGLAAETIEVSSAGESESGNVIKANEEAKRIESQAREQAESLLPEAVVGREARDYGGVRALVKRGMVPETMSLERPTVEEIILFIVKGENRR